MAPFWSESARRNVIHIGIACDLVARGQIPAPLNRVIAENDPEGSMQSCGCRFPDRISGRIHGGDTNNFRHIWRPNN